MVSKKICFYSGLFCVLLAFVSCSGLIGKLENATNFSSYTVKHFQQNLDDDEYTEVSEDAQILKGKNGSLTNATPNEYKGFTPKEIAQKKIIADGSTVIEVYYDRNICTVSFDTKGVGELSDITVRAGSKIARPADLVKNCYTFLGWCVDASGSSAFDFDNTAVFEDTTIYASWYTLVGSVAKSAIEFDGKVFDKTEEVYVVPPGTMGIVESGEKHPDLVNITSDAVYFMGIFWKNSKIKLSPYIISKYEVTQELYNEIAKNHSYQISINNRVCTITLPINHSRNKPSNGINPLYPVDHITKYDAIVFCNILSTICNLEPVYKITNTSGGLRITSAQLSDATITYDLSANGYRLPTQAEWEFAARGGDPSRPEWNYLYSGAPCAEGVEHKMDTKIDDGIDEIGWYYNTWEDHSKIETHEVGLKKPNTLGLYDMTGNAWEYCNDTWDGYYRLVGETEDGYVIDPVRLETRPKGVFLLGGAYNSYAANVTVCYLHCNDHFTDVNTAQTAFGFRLVRSCRE